MLAAILAIGGGGAAAAAWGMSQGRRWARWSAALGCVALLVVLVLALAMDAPPITGDTVVSTDGWFRGAVVPTGFLRLAVALWALDAVLVIGIAWLMGGAAALRGLLPATLAALAGGVVALGATDLTLGVAVAGATGLVSLAVLHAMGRTEDVAVGARELRVVVGAALLLFVGIAVAPVAAGLELAASASSIDGTPSAGEAGAVLGFVALAITAGVAARFGSIPFHFRIPRLTDSVPPIANPLLLVWLPLPVAIVGLAALDALVGPLALPLNGEQSLIVAVALVTMAAAAFAAFMAQDIRHAVGYLVIADGGLVLLGFAALDPEAWGPTRIWLVAIAASKTALTAWGAVAEGRFETRSIPDLRGWARHAPILAAGFVLMVVATYGIPGWLVLSARLDLASLVAGGLWAVPLTVGSLLTLPVYLRLFLIGLGPRSSQVSRAVTERRPQFRLSGAMDAGRTPAPAADEPADAGDGSSRPGRASRSGPGEALRLLPVITRAVITAVRRDSTELISAAVLALAVLATLTAWGALDLGSAAREPAPITSGPATD